MPASNSSSTSSSMGAAAQQPIKMKRERLRKKYFNLLDDLNSQQQQMAKPESAGVVLEKLKKCSHMANYVTDTREACFDFKALRQLSEICTNLTIHSALTSSFDPIEFMSNVRDKFSPNSFGASLKKENFLELCNKWAGPGLHLADSYKHVDIEETVASRREQENLTQSQSQSQTQTQTKPKRKLMRATDFDESTKVVVQTSDNVAPELKHATEKTAEIVEEYFKRIRREAAKYEDGILDLFDICLDPGSYGNTTENIFYLSFLVRDGLLRIFLDEGKMPCVCLTERGKRNVTDSTLMSDEESAQLVVGLTMAEWTELCKEWDIQKPFFQRS